jgi:hypothetical protein
MSSAREYIMFAPAQLLCKWHEKRSINRDDLYSSHGEVGRVLHGVGLLLISFLYRSTRLLLDCFLNDSPCSNSCGTLFELFA